MTRVSRVKGRSQVTNVKEGLWKKRDVTESQFILTKQTGGSFKGVVREDGSWHRSSYPWLLYGSWEYKYKRVNWLRWLLCWGGSPHKGTFR